MKKYLENELNEQIELDLSSTFGEESKLKQKSKLKLPEYYIDDAEISDFFEKLIFSVNMPNEFELGKIITEELSDKFKLNDCELVADYFLRVTLDWFKFKGHEEGREGTFFSSDQAKSIFTSANEKIDKLMLVSFKKEFDRKIEELGVKFQQDIIDELQLNKDLVSGNNLQIISVETKHITLSAIKLYQILQSKREYKRDDSFIFISLKSLLCFQDKVMQAFKSPSCNLLVIECPKDKVKVKEGTLNDICVRLSELMIHYVEKKIVIIGKDKKANCLKKKLISHNKKYHEIKDSKNTFDDLTQESQKKLLNERKVYFHEYEISLNELNPKCCRMCLLL